MCRTLALVALVLLLLFVAIAPAIAQDETPIPGGTFEDSQGRYTLVWDPDDFTGAENSGNVTVENDLGQLLAFVSGMPSATDCVADRVYSDSIPPTLVIFEPIAPEPAPDMPFIEASDARLVQFQDAARQISWYGCAPLVDSRGTASGFLMLRFSALETDWADAVESFEPVFAGVEISEPDPAWTESLQGNVFTHLADGWSVTWDAERYEPTISGLEQVEGVHLIRTGTVEYGDVISFDGPVDACLDDFDTYFATYDGMVSWEAADDLKGLSTDVEGAVDGLWRFKWISTAEGNPEKTAVEYAICLPMPGDAERSIRLSFSTTEDLFKSTRKGWQAILTAIELPGGSATPVP